MQVPQDKYINANGLLLHCLEWGETQLPTMLLIHGICGNAHYWDFFADRLCDDYHIIAIDQRGHGDSGWAESYGPRYYISDLELFVNQLQLEDFILIGHSLGGINAMIYTERNPDKVSKLVIVDIGPELGAAGAERLEKELLSGPDLFSSIDEVFDHERKLEPFCTDEFLRYQIENAVKVEDRRLVFKFDSKLKQTEMRSPEWLWEHLERILCPTLLLHGVESDLLLPEVAQKMVNLIPNCTLVDIESAAHGIVGDNPQAFEQAVREFLK